MPRGLIDPQKGKLRWPAGGQHPIIRVRIPADLIEKVDTWAKGYDLSRSEAVRRFIERGLGKGR
jgi:hypothetical protein